MHRDEQHVLLKMNMAQLLELLLVFSVTPFKIDQNKNQNRSIDGFHGDVIRLQSQKSEVLRILIYTRLKINRK